MSDETAPPPETAPEAETAPEPEAGDAPAAGDALQDAFARVSSQEALGARDELTDALANLAVRCDPDAIARDVYARAMRRGAEEEERRRRAAEERARRRKAARPRKVRLEDEQCARARKEAEEKEEGEPREKRAREEDWVRENGGEEEDDEEEGPRVVLGDAGAAAAAAPEEGVMTQLEQEVARTERERLIKTGQATPFANVKGLERREAAGAVPEGGDGDALGIDDTGKYDLNLWVDDGDTKLYQRRIQAWQAHLARRRAEVQLARPTAVEEGKVEEEKMRDGQDEEGQKEEEAEGETFTLGRSTEDSKKRDEKDDDYDDELFEQMDDFEEEGQDEGELSRLVESPFSENALEHQGSPDVEDEDVNCHESTPTTREETEAAGEDCAVVAAEPHQERIEFEGGFSISRPLFNRLYQYQRVAVNWLWELYCQNVGGILGDEMGLGKTVTTLAFLASLMESRLIDHSVLVVCPLTVMNQWISEFHRWAPSLRAIILHETGTAEGKGTKFLEKKHFLSHEPYVFVTTYATVRNMIALFRRLPWSYVVLDEGHKIRNPDAAVTLACKMLDTPHRLILTGTPIQNNLTELWSLFDFVFPGKLGTLPMFQQYWVTPISLGSYSSASKIAVNVAYRCASTLKETISPYLLRRLKCDVLPQMPKKTEEVLFCALTSEQREMYQLFLTGGEMKMVRNGKRKLLFAIDYLRKVCNHPDLITHPQTFMAGQRWMTNMLKDAANGSQASPLVERCLNRSGKIVVLGQLLKVWKSQKHKVLVFCQTQQMLNIVEVALRHWEHSYMRMDGSTNVRQRTEMIDQFNSNPNIFAFILTTHVGGLGLNLTGADHVVLVDPDWNPAVDEQARERVLRIGQKHAVTIYRLITAGTIEEKVYHRQLFKNFLKNSVLKDPMQRRLFRESFLKELFCLLPPEPKKTQNHKSSGGKATVGQTDPETVVLFSEAAVSTDGATHKRYNDEDGEDDDDGADGPKGNENSNNGEVDLLKKLIDNDSISTAVNHDMIVDGREESLDAESREVEHEANRFVSQSIRALKRSRALCKQQQEQDDSGDGTKITWTGLNGTAGAPMLGFRGNKGLRRFGGKGESLLSSQSVLETLKSQKEMKRPDVADTTSTEEAGEEGRSASPMKNTFDTLFPQAIKLPTKPLSAQKNAVESYIFAPPRKARGVQLLPTSTFPKPEAPKPPAPAEKQGKRSTLILPSNPFLLTVEDLRKERKEAAEREKEVKPEELMNRFTHEVHRVLLESPDHTATIYALNDIFSGVVKRAPIITALVFKKTLKQLATYKSSTQSWTLKSCWVENAPR